MALNGSDLLEEDLEIDFTSCLLVFKVDLLEALQEQPDFHQDLVIIDYLTS